MSAYLEGLVWALPGAAVGIIAVLMIWRQAQGLHRAGDGPVDRSRLHAVQVRIWRGYAVRIGVTTIPLAYAALQGVRPLLWATGATMAARWIGMCSLMRWHSLASRRRLLGSPDRG